MTREEIEADPLFRFRWYHHLELTPGLFTATEGHANVILTRTLLRGCEVRDRSCLDIGAMDGMMSWLMERRGARHVTAYDRRSRLDEQYSNGDRFRFVHKIFNSKVDLIWNVPLRDLPQAAAPSDVVVFSGVLYHMFDPMSGLATARGLVRNGGLMVIETAAILDNSMSMYFNADGRFHPWMDYWFVSLDCCDYLLRYFHLRVLDCCHLYCFESHGKHLIRLGLVCRAVPGYLGGKEDPWMKLQDTGLIDPDFNECLDWPRVESDAPDVPYRTSGYPLVMRDDVDSVDIWQSIRQQQPLSVTEFHHLRTLQLDDEF